MDYASPWKPIYETWSRLRCLSHSNPAPSGEAAVRFALNLLIPDEFSGGTFATIWQTHRSAAQPDTREALEVAIDRWGAELEALHSVRAARVWPESGPYEDVYHLALALAVGRERPAPRSAWLSAHGLMPQLPEDLGLDAVRVRGTSAEGRELLVRCFCGYLERRRRSAPLGRIALLARFHWALTQRMPRESLVRSLRLAKQTAEILAEPDAVPRDIPWTYHRQVELGEETSLLWGIWREILPDDRDWPR